MNKNAKIYVAGHLGLVGSALLRRLAASRVRHAHPHSTMRIAKWSLAPFFARGVEEKTRITVGFLKHKMQEYEQLLQEIVELKREAEQKVLLEQCT